MAPTWNGLKYTGFDAFNSIAVDTVNKLLYTSTASTILEWDPAAGTRTDIGTPVVGADLVVTFFKGAPYVAWFDTANLLAGVAKYTGSWSNVYTVPPGKIADTAESPYIINIDDSTLVVLLMMVSTGEGPSLAYMTLYSGDGSSWTQGSLAGDVDGYAAPTAFPSLLNYTFGFLTQQLSPAYFLGSQNPSLGSSACDIYVWEGSNWQLHVANFTTTGATVTKRVQSRGTDKWWKEESGIHYYSNVLTGSWSASPTLSGYFSGGQFNMPKTPGVRRAFSGIKYWDNAALDWDDDSLAEQYLLTYGPGRFIFRYNDGDAYVIARNNSTGIVYLLSRSEPLDGPTWPPTPASGNRTWIYKTTDGGESWISRGVKV